LTLCLRAIEYIKQCNLNLICGKFYTEKVKLVQQVTVSVMKPVSSLKRVFSLGAIKSFVFNVD